MPNNTAVPPSVSCAQAGLTHAMFLAAARVTQHHARKFEARLAALAAPAQEEPAHETQTQTQKASADRR